MRYILLLVMMSIAACRTEAPPVIPVPIEMQIAEGVVNLDAKTRVLGGSPLLLDIVAEVLGNPEANPGASGAEDNALGTTSDDVARADITLSIDQNIGRAEAYRLAVSESGVQIVGSDDAGLFYGVQTLRQLVRADGSLPIVEINDAPRFPYRGMMLDVGRHFFSIDFVKRYIDLLARYKFNTFHWHLTEDQGWRIEIKKYPRLTEVGSRRSETILEKNFDPYVGDGTPHSGFYTQDEVREVVAYAAERHVMVIPEIEMPGHARAALAAYPELACTPGPFEVSTIWGIHDDVFCPSEATFTFLEDVLVEVMDLFPSPFIHIGADEVPKRRWKESELAQDVMKREGLENEEELQSWFIRRIDAFLNKNGRRLIGWDEILEGGLAPNATVMSWRGTEGGIAAARQGHDVVMSPTRFAYFDFYQGDKATEPLSADWSGYPLPLDTVYAFEPVPAELTADEAKHILGAQGNVWTEYMPTPERVEYMVLPRMLAMAEVVWSPLEARDRADFRRRLAPELERLGVLGYSYRPLDR